MRHYSVEGAATKEGAGLAVTRHTYMLTARSRYVGTTHTYVRARGCGPSVEPRQKNSPLPLTAATKKNTRTGRRSTGELHATEHSRERHSHQPPRLAPETASVGDAREACAIISTRFPAADHEASSGGTLRRRNIAPVRDQGASRQAARPITDGAVSRTPTPRDHGKREQPPRSSRRDFDPPAGGDRAADADSAPGVSYGVSPPPGRPGAPASHSIPAERPPRAGARPPCKASISSSRLGSGPPLEPLPARRQNLPGLPFARGCPAPRRGHCRLPPRVAPSLAPRSCPPKPRARPSRPTSMGR